MSETEEKTTPRGSGRWSWLAVLALSLVFPLTIALQPRPGEAVAAVFPPWVDGEQAVARVWRADGRATGLGGLANIVLMRGAGPELFSALHAEGAILIIDATLAGMICRVD